MSSSRRSIRLLEICKNMKQLKQTHTQIIKEGLGKDNFALSRLMAFCSDPIRGSLSHTRMLFDRIDQPTTCICNTMIKAFLLKGELVKTIGIYMQMMLGYIYPDNYTFPYVFKACSYLHELELGEQIHSHVVKLGFLNDIFVGNTMILMYSVCGNMKVARNLFDFIPHRTEVAWTLMISGYSKHEDVDTARLLFDEAPVKDRGVWGSMISGYVQNNCFKEGLKLFQLMQLANVDPDEAILVSILCACAQLGALDLGIWINRYVERVGVSLGVRFGTALIDMYTKCGCMDLAKKVFTELPQKDSVCWNVMILGLAMHGDGDGAFELFSEMKSNGFSPDDVTFIAIFTACSHAGMVERGLDEFNKMKKLYGVESKAEHYCCVVDFLGRAGLFKEAMEIIQQIRNLCSPSEEAIAWRALLSACYNHRESNLAEIAAEHLVQLERHSGAYVLLSNIYAAAGRFDDAKKVKKLMKEHRVEKTPGCSSIELSGSVHEFVAGEETHHQMEDIYILLDKINAHLEFASLNW